ncbi:hypothetical protein BGX29_001303, partial [Mortierella sp. GBA35]
PHHRGGSGSGAAAASSKGKSGSSGADEVPKWMLMGDRGASQVVQPHRSSQVVISRRASLSSQNVLRNAEGDVIPMSTAPELAVIDMQQQPQLQQLQHQLQQQQGQQYQHNDYAYEDHHPDEEPYQDMYQSHEELRQQQKHQQHLQQMFGSNSYDRIRPSTPNRYIIGAII